MTSSFEVVAEMACGRKDKTEVLSAVQTLFSTLEHIATDHSSDTGTLSGGGKNNYYVCDLQPNPPLAKDQNKKCHEPHASGAPTTKANKRAANASNRKQKAATKEKEVAHALGRIREDDMCQGRNVSNREQKQSAKEKVAHAQGRRDETTLYGN
jgi:hypothetical protein